MRLSPRLLLPWLGVLAACAQTTAPRDVSGHLDTRAFAVSRGAVVVGVSSSNRLYTSALTTRGGFRLSLPTNDSYRLVLAEPSAKGYRAVARIHWLTAGGSSRWALLKEGPGIKFSKIQPSTKRDDDKDVEKDDDTDVDAKVADDVDNGTQCDADHWKGHGKDSDGDEDEDRDRDHSGGDGGHMDRVVASAFDSTGSSSSGGSVSDCEGHDKEGHDKDGVEGDDHDGDGGHHDDGDDVDCTVTSNDGGTATADGGVTPVDGGTSGSDAGTQTCGTAGATCTSPADCCVGTTCGSGFCTAILN